MNRSYFSASLLTLIGLLVSATALVVALTLFLARDQAVAAADARLVSALELTRTLAALEGDALVNTVRRVSGIDLTLRSGDGSGRVLATSRVGSGNETERVLQAQLGQGGSAVHAEFTVSQRQALRDYREFAARLAALAFAICSLGVFIAWLALARIAQRFVARPMREVLQGIERVRQGVYSEELDEAGDDTVGRIARAFNRMQAEVAERESRIVHHAEHDALTGLTNRSVVTERMRAVFGRAQRRGVSVVAMLIDIERFGDVNDTLGLEVGDAVLKEVARRLASNTRATDLLARVGGDEFLIVVEDMDEQLATHISAFLAETLQQPIAVGGRELSLRVRIGVASYPSHCDSAEGLRRLANVALTTARETGQGVVMYAPGQDERHLRELAILNDLPAGLKLGQLQLHFQPKIDIRSRSVETVEALVRWHHPQLGRIPPDEFISVLEENNQTELLTDWILKTAIEQAQDWSSRGYDIGIAVNLSANDLHDIGLAKRIDAMMRHFLVEPSRIMVEVTESAVMRDPERAREVLQALRDIGLRIAIDDFGTGQTSLSLLKQLPLNELKIDRAFVQELRTDSGDAIIVKSTIDLGHNMGLLVVAEGVESTYAWNLLKSYRCDLVQGYLVSKPLPPEQLEAWYLRLQARQASKLDFSFLDKSPEPAAEPTDLGDVLAS